MDKDLQIILALGAAAFVAIVVFDPRYHHAPSNGLTLHQWDEKTDGIMICNRVAKSLIGASGTVDAVMALPDAQSIGEASHIGRCTTLEPIPCVIERGSTYNVCSKVQP